MEVSVGNSRYKITTDPRGAGWVAQAVNVETGGRYGPEVTGVSEHQAVEQVSTWLGWQAEHVQALDVLQQAERAYHRAIAGTAFAAAAEESAAGDLQRELLESVDAARRALDLIRARKPL